MRYSFQFGPFVIWNRLIDGIEPDILAKIEHAPMHIAGVRAVREVRARWTGHKVYGDVTIEVDPLLSVDKADTLAMEVQASLREYIPLLSTAVVRGAHPERVT